jgi:hypothetical protein
MYQTNIYFPFRIDLFGGFTTIAQSNSNPNQTTQVQPKRTSLIKNETIQDERRKEKRAQIEKVKKRPN